MNVYITMQENDHYVYYNVAKMIVIPNGYPASTATRECSPDQKGAQEVCELTDGFILTRVNCVEEN